MATYNRSNAAVSIDNNAGTPVVFTGHVKSLSEFGIEAVFDQSDSFGDSWEEYLFAGLKTMPEITLSGNYDDAANGPDALFASYVGSTTSRTTLITIGGSKTYSVECFVKSFRWRIERGKTTGYTLVLRPSGTVTLA